MLLASLQQCSGQVGQLPDTTNTEENGDEEGQEEEENEVEEDDMANKVGWQTREDREDGGEMSGRFLSRVKRRMDYTQYLLLLINGIIN